MYRYLSDLCPQGLRDSLVILGQALHFDVQHRAESEVGFPDATQDIPHRRPAEGCRISPQSLACESMLQRRYAIRVLTVLGPSRHFEASASNNYESSSIDVGSGGCSLPQQPAQFRTSIIKLPSWQCYGRREKMLIIR